MVKWQILILHHLSINAYNFVTKAARGMTPTLPDGQLNFLYHRLGFDGGTKSALWCKFACKTTETVKTDGVMSENLIFSNRTKNERCSEKKIYVTQVPNDLVKVKTHISSYSY